MFLQKEWIFTVFLIVQVSSASEWTYTCTQGHCIKTRLKAGEEESAISLPACQLFCTEYASIWPKPTGKFSIAPSLSKLNLNSIDVITSGDDPMKNLVSEAAKRFKDNIDLLAPQKGRKAGGKSLIVNIEIAAKRKLELSYGMDESYNLNVSLTSDGRINADISAPNYFGSRHGLETLYQLIIFDDIRNEFLMADKVYVEDKPVYFHRGILLDTARSYMSIEGIKRAIEGMAASKMNIFHWHITDSHSFPYVSKSEPKLSGLGAYSPSSIYTPEDIEDLIKYATVRGVKIMPEFDAPAHVGEGWQDTDYVVCFNKKPWQDFCVEPPCGQLNPTKEGMYDVLENIYKDMVAQFNPDIFHMGGDEVSTKCWESEDQITQWMTENNIEIDEAGFMKLWDKFQSTALQRFYKQRGQKVPIIMWTSTLTDSKYIHYLPNDTYIIQIWTKGDDPTIQMLLEKGYRTILSNYDALYLDCGFAGWVDSGHNWCSPYVGWQTVYENSPTKIAGVHKDLMMGSEAALWSEQADSSSVDGRLWPRASALAERLWSDPKTTWKDAESRFLIQRERLVKLKINADAIEPEWCLRNQGTCPLDGILNVP